MKISKLAIKSVFVAAVLALTACASMGVELLLKSDKLF